MAFIAIARFVAALALAAGLLITPSSTAVPVANAAGLSHWTGSVDLYRAGTFSSQKTYLWCTAADVQIARNIVRGRSDHSRANQSFYFDWMRARNRYDIPVRDGVDPQGWAAGMRNFVDARYRLATFRSYTSALRSAVTSLRLTNRPVGVLVARGGHAWLMTGFSATSDPAATRDFTVTSVRVVGPLYGLQSENGYDMPPNTSLSAGAFRRFFTPWHYASIRMSWEGLYATIEAGGGTVAPAPRAARALHPPIPAVTRPWPSPRPSVAAGSATQPEASAAAPSVTGVAPTQAETASDVMLPPIGLAALALVGVVALGFALRLRRGHPRSVRAS
jgi:hypothetical protein